MKRLTKISQLLILLNLILSFPIFAFAGTYWVSPTGNASWSNAQSTVPLSGTACCSLNTANKNASAGDTINLRAGSYSTGISPVNDGTSRNKIIWQAYNGEMIVIQNVTAVNLTGDDYHIIDGIIGYDNRTGGYNMVDLPASNYNEIRNCTFYREGEPNTAGYALLNIRDLNGDNGGSTHNWIHDNTMYGDGSLAWEGGECNDKGRVIMLGDANAGDTISNYNTLERNHFYHGGHHVISIESSYNIFRNNIVHNECWMAKPPAGYTISDCAKGSHEGCTACGPGDKRYGKYGGRNVFFQAGRGYNLCEGNRIGHAGRPPDDDGANNLITKTPHNILRYNYIFGANSSGIYLRDNVDYNYVYNNTVYYNGQIDNAYMEGGADYAGIVLISDSCIGNQVVNNLLYDNQFDWKGTDVRWSTNTRRDNWCTTNEGPYCSGYGDPKFTNTTVTWWNDPDYTATRPDLTLQGNSPCIDNGSYLTRANNSGSNSTTLITDDAGFFQDGTWGSSLSHNQADCIAIEAVTNVVQISSINYNTKTITLLSPMTWGNGAKIWLYKNSKGEQVLYGSAPDYGAHEYGYISISSASAQGVAQGVAPSPPKNVFLK